MGKVLLYAVSWQLRINPDGMRRIDLELVTGPKHSIIECIGVDQTQRCFIADPNKSDALFERIQRREPMAPNIRGIYCSLYEDLSTPVSPPEKHDWSKAQSYGSADLSNATVTLRASPKVVDELIRQDTFGHKLFYIELAIAGLEHTTQENNEGGLVEYRWQSRSKNGDHHESSVTAFALHYCKSTTYEPSAAPITPLSPEHLTPLSNALALVLAELKRINWFVQILCILAIVIIGLIWRR